MQKQAKRERLSCVPRRPPPCPSVVTCTNGWIKSGVMLPVGKLLSTNALLVRNRNESRHADFPLICGESRFDYFPVADHSSGMSEPPQSVALQLVRCLVIDSMPRCS